MSIAHDHSPESWDGGDRRASVRLAAEADVRVHVLDAHGQPVAKLLDAELIDVSAQGLSVASPIGAPGRARLRVVRPDGPPVIAEVVAVSAWFHDRYRMHCRVVTGDVPAGWVAGWRDAA
ncbi:MAG: PilZ domain-containing protein [Planctomycetota bacterium]